MDSVDDIRNRIKDRRYQLIDGQVVPQKARVEEKKPFQWIHSFFVIIAVLFSSLIYMKSDEKGVWLQSTFGIQTNFSEVNLWFNSYVSQILEWDFLTGVLGDDQTVVANSFYVQLDTNEYVNATSKVLAVDDGTILWTEANEDGSTLLIVSHDNGFVASYLNVYDAQVEKNDRVSAGAFLGMMNDSVSIIFHVNQEQQTYVEILQILE